MEIATNAIVGLTYELKVSKEEDEIESAPFSVEVRDQEDPFYFLYGNSGLPEKFEEFLIGKKEGDTFNFVVPSDEAYGEADEELIMTLPKEQFSEDRGFNSEMLAEGNFLPLVDENGYPMQAKVLKVMDSDVLLDFNHPLVGFNLHFDGEIFEVREATEEEIANANMESED